MSWAATDVIMRDIFAGIRETAAFSRPSESVEIWKTVTKNIYEVMPVSGYALPPN
jgi:hypothetical protein